VESKVMTLKAAHSERGRIAVRWPKQARAVQGTQNIAGQWGRFMSGPYGEIDHKLDGRRSASQPARTTMVSNMCAPRA
jgi:hypothetical protein